MPEYLFAGKIRTCGCSMRWGGCGSILPALSGVWGRHAGTQNVRLFRQAPGSVVSAAESGGSATATCPLATVGA